MIVFLFFFSLCNEYRRVRIRINNPKQNPQMVRGRLPGESWIEHNPPKFNALQSFEMNSKIYRVILTLNYAESELNDKKFLMKIITSQDLSSNYTVETPLPTREGSWQRIYAETETLYVRLYGIKKKDKIFWIQFISDNKDTMANLTPDVHRYVEDFWFVY